MAEPLRDVDLRDYWELADRMAAEQLPIYASVVRELLTEVARLKAENDRLKQERANTGAKQNP